MTNGLVAQTWKDLNDDLFVRRQQLQQDLESLSANDCRRKRLQRELDGVTHQFIQQNMGLVHNYCRRFIKSTSRHNRDDFYQAGAVGLMKALETFDLSFGVSFASWSYVHIRNHVLQEVHIQDYPTMTMGSFERRCKVVAIQNAYASQDVDVDAAGLGAMVGVSARVVEQALRPVKLQSIDAAVGTEDGSILLSDTVASEAPGPDIQVVESFAMKAVHQWALVVLTDRELKVILERFGLDGGKPRQLADIGRELGIGRERVRQIEATAIAKMRHPLVLKKIQAEL